MYVRNSNECENRIQKSGMDSLSKLVFRAGEEEEQEPGGFHGFISPLPRGVPREMGDYDWGGGGFEFGGN